MTGLAIPDTLDLDFPLAGPDPLAPLFAADYLALRRPVISETPTSSSQVARLQRRVALLERELAAMRSQLKEPRRERPSLKPGEEREALRKVLG